MTADDFGSDLSPKRCRPRIKQLAPSLLDVSDKRNQLLPMQRGLRRNAPERNGPQQNDRGDRI
jgi:hypothetical protein